ncbi:YrrS family protein [Virgibacillus halodenitrificans]|uniref:YrrS family protein n=1 Tax=Virgibacillus halodenitrificans TaxID=1482 RepID=A0ABR7VLT9_VIRHA|nr:YrrS family protein [Virgibacillus halodenitrificans]MBD1222880.1 YrrS family protein [Virgibacillus halodenitrificans]CDQ35415.1 Type IV secretory pathway, VirB10 components [Virgibacillus halodenitrificans]
MANNNDSRVDKFEKRRKNTKSISILLILGAVLLILLIGIWIFGGGDKENTTDQTQPSSQEEQNSTDEENESFYEKESKEDTETDQEENSSSENDGNTDKEDEEQEEIEKQEVDSSDENVLKAYTADWKPIGTEQEEPHTTNYSDGSQDRIEIKEAVLMVTDIPEQNLVMHWVGNGGDQKVEATVSNEDNSEIYRVYLSWVEGEGWQPTKLEELKTVKY